MISPILTRQERRAFVDSSAYLALLDRRDEHHRAAIAISRWLAQERFRLYTTNTVVIEAHALILSAMGTEVATRFLHDVDRGITTIIRTRARDEDRAKALIYRYADKEFSFTDAISFITMERLGLVRAFTFDSDFAQYGFVVLTPS
jgi:uncharacterized protein